jgi:hypothetical protein
VPDFNASIKNILARSPPTQPSNQRSLQPNKTEAKKHNLLGLTPTNFEQDSEPEDDADEEQRLAAQTAPAAGGYLFEYNGNPLVLRNRDEILAWIAERKRRYPTAAKREAAKKMAEEEKKKREEEYKARLQARKDAQVKRDQERAEQKKPRGDERKKARQQEARKQMDNEMDEASRARLKAEKLRKKALKAQKDLEEAEEALLRAQTKDDDLSLAQGRPKDDAEPAPKAATTSFPSPTLDHDETSSSGSSVSDPDSASDSDSDSDLDSAPEVLSTKDALGSSGVASEFSQPRAGARNTPVCKYFARTRRCKHGSACRYSHDLSQKSTHQKADGKSNLDAKNAATTTSGNVKRKGLWQVMVEKEEEAERKRVLEAIITLGQRGLLDNESGK